MKYIIFSVVIVLVTYFIGHKRGFNKGLEEGLIIMRNVIKDNFYIEEK